MTTKKNILIKLHIVKKGLLNDKPQRIKIKKKNKKMNKLKETHKNFILNMVRPGYTITTAAEKSGITRQTGHSILKNNDDVLKFYNYVSDRINKLLDDIDNELDRINKLLDEDKRK